jgi:pre-mRNA-processing factor 19
VGAISGLALCSSRADLARLSSTRRKRAVPKGWVTASDIQKFEAKQPSWTAPKSFAFSSCTALSETSSLLYGGEDGTALVHSNDGSAADVIINCGSGITDGLFWEDKVVFSLSNGSVKVYDNGKEITSFSVHAGPATGLALHPCGDLLASIGSDKSYVLYDLAGSGPVSRVFADSGTSISCIRANNIYLTCIRTDVLPIPSRRTHLRRGRQRRRS